MPRSRNIKHSFFTNEELVTLPFDARLLFIGLWTLADREGRMEYRPLKIKIALFPCDDVNVEARLQDLAGKDFIEIYEVEGNQYIQVTNFSKHQNPHMAEKPRGYPPPPSQKAMHSTIQAPGEYGAGTVLEQDKQERSTGPTGLIPDSCNLIPDSLIPENGKARKFRKPTIDELIKAFTGKVKNPLGEANKFFNHYESNGWKVGKNQMKSWPHAVANWVTRVEQDPGNKPGFIETATDRSWAEG